MNEWFCVLIQQDRGSTGVCIGGNLFMGKEFFRLSSPTPGFSVFHIQLIAFDTQHWNVPGIRAVTIIMQEWG